MSINCFRRFREGLTREGAREATRPASRRTGFIVGKSEARDQLGVFLEGSDGQTLTCDKGSQMPTWGFPAHLNSALLPGDQGRLTPSVFGDLMYLLV